MPVAFPPYNASLIQDLSTGFQNWMARFVQFTKVPVSKKLFSIQDILQPVYRNSTTEKSLFNLLVDAPKLYGGMSLDDTNANLTHLTFPSNTLHPSDIFRVTILGAASTAGFIGPEAPVAGSAATFVYTFYGITPQSDFAGYNTTYSAAYGANELHPVKLEIVGYVSAVDSATGLCKIRMSFVITDGTVGVASTTISNLEGPDIDLKSDVLSFMVSVRTTAANVSNCFWINAFWIELF
jgi:hypothetical protein